MPFPETIREEVLVKSHRRCCVCHEFAGRSVNVHHIMQEADGGPNTMDNAIALCQRCHAEAGHYNARHPLGTKYSPQELKKHRDQWWSHCEVNPSEPNARHNAPQLPNEPSPTESESPMPSSPPLSRFAQDILASAARTGEIYIIKTDRLGELVRCGQNDKLSSGTDPYVNARYLDAFHELCALGLVRHQGDILHTLTGRGFDVARGLQAKAKTEPPASAALAGASESILAVTFKRFPSSTGELAKYWLVVAFTNNSEKKQDAYALDLYFPFDIPVECADCQSQQPEEIDGLRFRRLTIKTSETLYRTRTVQLVDEHRHPVVYQMNSDLFWQGRGWRFLWKMSAGNLVPLEGCKPWKEMHNF